VVALLADGGEGGNRTRELRYPFYRRPWLGEGPRQALRRIRPPARLWASAGHWVGGHGVWRRGAWQLGAVGVGSLSA
jgi:hypothetical protein